MLKKIMLLLFVGVVSTVSTVSSATDNEPTINTKNSVAIVDSTIREEIPVHTADINSDEVKSTVAQDADKSEPILPTIWMLSIALFGFVVLSNRSGV
ncbi:MAG: hypothetical protein WBL28_11245 [Methylotenera sp.]